MAKFSKRKQAAREKLDSEKAYEITFDRDPLLRRIFETSGNVARAIRPSREASSNPLPRAHQEVVQGGTLLPERRDRQGDPLEGGTHIAGVRPERKLTPAGTVAR